MMVFWKAGLVFLAVPKTGTQAYAAALADQADIVIRHPPGLKHTSARKYRRKLLPYLDPGRSAKLSLLAVIREPVDWLGSWYRYRSRPHLSGHPNSTEGISFDQFVEAYLAPDQPAFASLGSQARFVSNGAGKVIVNHLFSYDNQAGLNDFLTARLKVDISLDKVNVSPRRTLQLSPALRDQLETTYAPDFALYRALRDAETSAD